MKTKLLIAFLLSNISITLSQNLLDTSTWTVGSGAVTGFSNNGTTTENSRELGENHLGKTVLLWKASPDNISGADGGWNSNYTTINHTKTHQFTVWLKKTNSNDGTSYFGCNSTDNILTLSGTVNNNPYFWYGDLPELNKWYLLIGYIHGSSYASSISIGGIYDGETGKKVISITDYKFKSTAINVRHRSYLYYDTNIADRQYFYAPRIEEVNGLEYTFNQLLGINENSKLVFNFDNAGNQNQRFYCESSICSVPTPSAKTITTKEEVAETENLNTVENQDLIADGKLNIYPNPTREGVFITFQNSSDKSIKQLNVFNAYSSLVKIIAIDKNYNHLEFDLSGQASGLYLFIFVKEDGSTITEKVIKY